MTQYLDLYAIKQNNDLKQKVSIAILVAANTVRQEDPATQGHSARITWAKDIVPKANKEAENVLALLIADNKDTSIENILSASDEIIQGKVDEMVNLLAGNAI